MDNVKMFKMLSGEFVISGVESVSADKGYVLNYPASIIPVPQQQGQIGFGMFAPFSDYDKEITMNPNSVAVESEPNSQIKDAYEQWMTQVKAQASGIIMANRMPSKPTVPGNGSKADFSKLNM